MSVKHSKTKVVKVTTTKTKLTSSLLANKYLLPSTNAEVNNPKIVALAKSITNGAKSTDYYTKAKLIYNWVQVNIDHDLNADTSAVAILSNKGSNGNYKAYCVGFTNVMSALCRAAGVPTRAHAILFFEQDQYPFQGHEGHVWSEVYVNGKWVYADAATVGFIAPLGYKSYLQEMPTNPGGSYVTYTDSWNYWDFSYDHSLTNHYDFNIQKEATGVPVLEYFKISTSITSTTQAYTYIYKYASQNGYIVYKNDYFTGSTDYLNPNVYVDMWAFHFFDSSGNFLGYIILDKNGILYPALQTVTYITPGTTDIPLNYY